ncbi:MAG: hypothetical protein IJM50_06990 [Lachnospiraceae bacterium]|nr:hypothetical protein [Lachnospiraceae bacterium]
MKKEDLFEAVGGISDRFITEEPDMSGKRVRSSKLRGSLALAASVLLIAGIGIFSLTQRMKDKETVFAYAPVEKHVSPDEIFQTSGDETAYVPRWDEMMDVQRFKTLMFEGREYRTMLILVHDVNVGESLGEGTLSGQDIYDEDRIRYTDGRVCSISGISKEAAVCVYFPDEPGRAYAYVNTDYRPDTLGSFMEDLNFAKYFGTRHVIVCRGSEKDVVFEDIPTQTVLSMLLSDASAANEPGHAQDEKLLTIGASLDVVGNHNKVLTLTKEGYLWTNLLESEKCFFVGKEKAEAFFKEVTEHHRGFIYIYDLYDGLTGIKE